jgi:hypothetical protein
VALGATGDEHGVIPFNYHFNGDNQLIIALSANAIKFG